MVLCILNLALKFIVQWNHLSGATFEGKKSKGEEGLFRNHVQSFAKILELWRVLLFHIYSKKFKQSSRTTVPSLSGTKFVEDNFSTDGGGEVSGWFRHIAFIAHSISITSDHQALDPALELIYLSGSCKALRCGFTDSWIYMLSEAVGWGPRDVMFLLAAF